MVTIIALFDSYFLQFCSDNRLRSFSSNKLRLNVSKNLTLQLRELFLKNRIPDLWKNLPNSLRTEDLQ